MVSGRLILILALASLTLLVLSTTHLMSAIPPWILSHQSYRLLLRPQDDLLSVRSS